MDCFRAVIACLLCTSVPCISSSLGQAKTSIQLTDVTEKSQIGFHHTDGASGRRYVVESLTAGLAIFDYDNDGFEDIYFLNGSALPGTIVASPPTNALYRNNGNWTFSDVTRQAGVGDTGYGLGVVAGDYDQDGDLDLYVSNYGANVFYQNNGDGTFGEATQVAGLGSDRFGAGAAFVDIEGDGDLDLYLANYQQFTFDKHITRMIGDHQFHPGPHDYPPEYHQLFENQSDGTFLDISQRSGIGELAAPGMGVIAGDFDEDGDADIFVANDSYPNFLWINDGSGKFSEQAALAGVAVDRNGRENGNMGVECADFNNDQLLDFFTTTYQDEMPVLYQNLGNGFYNDATNSARIDPALTPHVSWGVGAVDFDHDADCDLFIACGHFMDNIRFIDDRTDVKVPNFLLQNQGGRFSNVSKLAGSGLAVVESSRGAAFDDLDNDGDADVAVLNFNAAPTIMRNDTPPRNHWLSIRLVGNESNRSGVGARVTLTVAGQKQTALVHAGRGYQSHYGLKLNFGLGAADGVDQVEVRWPSGVVQQVIPNVIDAEFIIREQR